MRVREGFAGADCRLPWAAQRNEMSSCIGKASSMVEFLECMRRCRRFDPLPTLSPSSSLLESTTLFIALTSK